MKITVLDGYTINPGDLSWEGLEKLGETAIYDRTPKDETVERIADCEAVLTSKVLLTKEIFEKCPNIKFVGVLATGYNVVDVDAAKELGITVCNVPEYSTDSVAEFVFALILEACHHVGEHNRAVKEGQWTESLDFAFWNYPLFELCGRTLGIIGYGKIGQAAAKLAAAFRMDVLAYSPSRKTKIDSDRIRYASLDEIYAGADIISLNCPLFPETAGMINAEAISKCKDGVIFVNTARGGLVVESDMKEALISGKVSYFAADVAAVEPINADSPLLSAPNTILTPHIAWASKEARKRLIETTVDNLRSYISGAPENVVNK